MIFNSFEFLLFLPFCFITYWFVFQRHLKAQNFFLLFVSYVFYGWWDWRFLSLIAFSSLVDFIAGQQIEKSKTKTRRRFFLWSSILTNLGFLGFFKYFNFFSESFTDLLQLIGFQANLWSLNVILPVGISFYTFQTMSYTIDLYRGHLKAEKDLVAFFAYVSFFPQLVAGPIERAVNLLPQFKISRKFTYKNGADGMRLIFWGLFKKVVIADNCAIFVDEVFLNYTQASSSELILGSFFFAFQIYGDFSGYSDIAIGTAKLLGFNLMTNFKTPYFSRDMAEFWRRWHISLSTWFRDYVYIPLGGSRVNKKRAVINTFIIFIVSGFWHGANWTFIIWGALNALYFLPLLLLGKNRK
ncbi:MBOAT family protein, partial [Fulvivirga lutimaris]|uniref:MBOAT family protein n=1 Tax=Fulvivirga lutimaris TaxID=1819566 RepID=UPI0016287B04|nr:MBOAT family protein [Fulvivirga lutimaris]